MRTNASGWVAATLVGLEGIGLVVLAVREGIALASGDSGSAASSIALLVLTALGAVAVLAFAIGIARGRSWGRSGGIVTQLLILAVALGALTGQYASPGIALALAVPALVTLVLIMVAARGAHRAERAAASDSS